MSTQGAAEARKAADRFKQTYGGIQEQIARVMVGQEGVVEGVLTALFAGGHVLLEGVPGLGKTLLISSLGRAVHLPFTRIQFTPDMMPADIIGTQVLVEKEGGGHEVEFEEGPLVSNIILADEINRATPKTQSALLQAMQEREISVGKRTIQLEEPYCVMATQNPVEQEGTYPLPEAQLDRFLFKLLVGYPEEHEYRTILDRTVGDDVIEVEAVSTGEAILEMRHVVRQVPVPEHVQDYAIRLMMGTQPGSKYATAMANDNVALGSSPRGAQALLLAGKVQALLAGRYTVNTDDIKKVAPPALRHRVIINFQGQSEGVTPDRIIEDVLAKVQPATEVASA
ncbi:MAG: MoxR family ATPase [Planctomycetota bacterium]|nr:MoxR family ATPase [Planctomycetota bacterium]